jgi:hypothetical protein
MATPFSLSIVNCQLFSYSVIQSFSYSVIQSFSYSVIHGNTQQQNANPAKTAKPLKTYPIFAPG